MHEGATEMIRLGICDDQPRDVAAIRQLVNQYALLHSEYELVVFTFTTPFEMLTFINEQGTFDILFLDIYMQGISGLDVAKELRAARDDIEIIFITSSEEHSLAAFDVDAAHYIVKPLTEPMLFHALDKVLARRTLRHCQYLIVKTSAGLSKLAVRDIAFMRPSKKNYQLIQTSDGECFEVRMTTEELFQQVSSDQCFFKCGAALIINLQYVRKVTKEFILLDSGETLAFPYRSYPALKDAFLNLYLHDTD